MERAKKMNIIVGVVSLLSLPLGILFINHYFNAPPSRIDSFDLGTPAPTCIPVETGGYVLQVPITRDDSWDTIDRITLFGPDDLVLERAALLDVGEQMHDEFVASDLARLASADDGWFEIGEVSDAGQVLALLVNTTSEAGGAAAAIEIATYGGETRWMDRLPLEILIMGGQCQVVVYDEPEDEAAF